MFNFNLFKKPVPTVEAWANHNAKKATPDDLIAGAIVTSFAKDFKHWKFVGEFNQRHGHPNGFRSTSLTRKMVGKKHVEIVFVFKHTKHSEWSGNGYSSIYKYVTIGCEVNGIRMTDAAFKYIYQNWQNIVVDVRRAEEVAARAKSNMQLNESKWDLAEGLLGMKRNGLGQLVPVKAAEGEAE